MMPTLLQRRGNGGNGSNGGNGEGDDGLMMPPPTPEKKLTAPLPKLPQSHAKDDRPSRYVDC